MKTVKWANGSMAANRVVVRDTRIYLYAAIAITVLSIAYWAMYVVNAYGTFHDYEGIGIPAYGMFYDVHYVYEMSPLQMFVYGNHLAPDQVFLLVPYFFIQSPLTLLIAQDIILSATGLLVFFVARDLLRSDGLGLMLCFAYLANPGMHGMLIFDYHEEYLIVPFYILTFYYYMKLNKPMFYISSALLLGAMDIAPIIAASLAVGLAAYEYIVDKNQRTRGERLRLSAILIIGCIAVLAVYNLMYFSLNGSYAKNPNFPTLLELQTVPLVPYNGVGAPGGENNMQQYALMSGSWPEYYTLLCYGIGVGLLGSGPAVLFAPVPAIIMASPWLAELLVFGNSDFASVFIEYFSFVIGAMIAAAILGFMSIMSRDTHRKAGRTGMLMPIMISITLSITVLLAIVSPFASLSLNVTNISQSFLFKVAPSQQAYYSQLDWVIAKVPSNASLMTQGFIMPHVLDRQYFELLGEHVYFQPKYILVDFNTNVSLVWNGGAITDAFQNYTSQHPYELVAQNGTARLYEEIQGFNATGIGMP